MLTRRVLGNINGKRGSSKIKTRETKITKDARLSQTPRSWCSELLRHPHHAPLYQSWKQLIQLDHRMHRPWHHHFTLPLQIAVDHRTRNPLGADSSGRLRPNLLKFVSLNGIDPEICPHIPRTHGHDVNARIRQLDPRSFADGIQRKFRSTINGLKGQRDMTSNARNIDNRSRALLPHDRNHRLHSFQRAK